VGREHLGCFGHEVNAGEDDDIGFGFGRLLAESEAVAYIVGYILNIAVLIIMGQDDGVFLALESVDFCYQIEGRVDIYIQKSFLL
jgi:hypothetical protein